MRPTMFRNLFPFLAVAGCLLAAPATHAQIFTLNVAAFPLVSITNVNGTFTFQDLGRPGGSLLDPTITLTSGVPLDAGLDGSAVGSWSPDPANADTTTVFTGTVSSALVLNGLSQVVSDGYSFDASLRAARPANFTGGATVTYNLGVDGIVAVTPIRSSSYRRATFLLTAADVPEPGALAFLAGPVLIAGYRLQRRFRKA